MCSRNSIVLLNFSPTEGVTIAPREGLVHGVVPVLSRFPGLVAEGVFRDGHNALTFEVGNIDAAARHVIALHREPGLLARLSAAAIVSQKGRHLFEGSMRAWADALDACLRAPLRCGRALPVDDEPRPRLERHGAARSRWPTGCAAGRDACRSRASQATNGLMDASACRQLRKTGWRHLDAFATSAAEARSTAAAPTVQP